MRFGRLTLKLRVKLNSEKEWMRRQFENLHQASVWALARESHSIGFKSTSVDIVKLIPMTMSFGDLAEVFFPVFKLLGSVLPYENKLHKSSMPLFGKAINVDMVLSVKMPPWRRVHVVVDHVGR